MPNTDDMVRALRASLDKLTDTERRQAGDLLTNISIYGAGYNQRSLLRTLLDKVTPQAIAA